MISVAEWREKYLPECDGCRWIYKQRGEPTPCKTCVIEPFPENRDALLIYSITKWQTCITEIGGKRVIDISISAIKDAMDMLGMEYNKDTFLKVRKLFHHFI